ncbi:hypothetical protein RchiOBHm_Chr5g0032501 [Rosa chinensis]|uniref:Uncharacterized protein n=1 Tax=Rosa chinensis TaxID=74649 RepID=A0A2P6QAG0_ROSCH|nr:hypothetical protein RchiOBHm_Chr5g0032501 [Rosa chinensis]
MAMAVASLVAYCFLLLPSFVLLLRAPPWIWFPAVVVWDRSYGFLVASLRLSSDNVDLSWSVSDRYDWVSDRSCLAGLFVMVGCHRRADMVVDLDDRCSRFKPDFAGSGLKDMVDDRNGRTDVIHGGWLQRQRVSRVGLAWLDQVTDLSLVDVMVAFPTGCQIKALWFPDAGGEGCVGGGGGLFDGSWTEIVDYGGWSWA